MKMKAAVLHEFNKPLVLESVPVPEIGRTDVLIRIRASGICLSDVHICRGREVEGMKTPLIPGHECAGVIERVGADVKNVKPGDRVVADYRLTCGQCYYCDSGRTNLCHSAKDIGFTVDGAFAEYIVLPSRQAFPLPDQISFEEGAIIGCAVVTAYHATRVAELRAGESVAVIGVGGVGFHILKLSRAAGAGRIIAVDLDDRKLARAAKLGAETINPQHEPADALIRKLTNGEGVDVAFEAIGLAKTVEAAVRSTSPRGKAVFVGLCFEKAQISPLWDMMWEPRIANSGRETEARVSIDHTRADMKEVIDLVAQRKVDLSDSITHKLSLDDANRGLEMFEKKIGDPVRIVMLQS